VLVIVGAGTIIMAASAPSYGVASLEYEAAETAPR